MLRCCNSSARLCTSHVHVFRLYCFFFHFFFMFVAATPPHVDVPRRSSSRINVSIYRRRLLVYIRVYTRRRKRHEFIETRIYTRRPSWIYTRRREDVTNIYEKTSSIYEKTSRIYTRRCLLCTRRRHEYIREDVVSETRIYTRRRLLYIEKREDLFSYILREKTSSIYWETRRARRRFLSQYIREEVFSYLNIYLVK